MLLIQKALADSSAQAALDSARVAVEQREIALSQELEAQRQRDLAQTQLALNYWENGRQARLQNNNLPFLHFSSLALFFSAAGIAQRRHCPGFRRRRNGCVEKYSQT